MTWLDQECYAEREFFKRVPLLMHFGEFAWARGARTLEDLPDQVCAFAQHWLHERGKNRSGEQGRKSVYNEACGLVQQFLRLVLPEYSQRACRGPIRIPFANRVPGYFEYLREERGLRPVTLEHHGHYLRRFEAYLKKIGLEDLAVLTLDDIDWKRERLRVPERKAGNWTAYPLSTVVGDAIVAYLQQGRPQTTDRHVFFRMLAPFQPMTPTAVSCRATTYLQKAGIKVAYAGSHTFRHTCVQRLVEADFSFKTIGDYVGHRSVSSTEVYTKIDVEALREVALSQEEAIS